MQRSNLRNIFLKNRTEGNRNNNAKQRNLCVAFLRKIKREFYGNLNEKKLCDKKEFWRVVKPVVVSNEKITLVETDNLVENDKKTATVLNVFFSNIITNLCIPQHIEGEPVSRNIEDPLMKAIIKYRLHPTIIAMKEKCISSSSFSFSQLERDEIIKEINNLKTNKATQEHRHHHKTY